MVHLEDEPNAGKAWTPEEIDILKRLASQQVPTRAIAEQLGRSEYSVRAKASNERIQLRSAKHHQAAKQDPLAKHQHNANQGQNPRQPR